MTTKKKSKDQDSEDKPVSEMREPEEIAKYLFENQRELYQSYTRIKGLRGIFDGISAEFRDSSFGDKLQVLSQLLNIGFRLRHLMEAAQKVIQAYGHDSRAAAYTVFNTATALFEHDLRLICHIPYSLLTLPVVNKPTDN